MAQQGTVSKRDGRWYLSYRDSVLVNGQLVRKQKMEKLPDVGDRYRCESDLADLVREKLDAAQAVVKAPKSASEFNQYVQDVYLPHVKLRKAASTAACYETYLERYILPRTQGLALRDFSVKVVADLLESCASMHRLNSGTCLKIRSIISAVFHLAANKGDLPAGLANPASHVFDPDSATEPKPTACPTVEQAKATLDFLQDAPLEQAAVAVAVYCGLRPGEIRGLQWADFDRKQSTLHIQRSLWHTVESKPKTAQSIALVPVVPALRKILMNLWRAQGSPISGRILAREKQPMNLDNSSKRVIAPSLSRCTVCQKSQLADHKGHNFERDARTSVPWFGFYSLRRFYGTQLREQSESSDTASKALRNSKEIADKHYNKPVAVLPDVRRAAEAASRMLA